MILAILNTIVKQKMLILWIDIIKTKKWRDKKREKLLQRIKLKILTNMDY